MHRKRLSAIPSLESSRSLRNPPTGRHATRVCCRFNASRVAARNGARLYVGGREWSFPCQVLQRQLAPFPAQPRWPHLGGHTRRAVHGFRNAAFLVAYLERPNFASRAISMDGVNAASPPGAGVALPREKTGSGAAAYETATTLARPASYALLLGRLVTSHLPNRYIPGVKLALTSV